MHHSFTAAVSACAEFASAGFIYICCWAYSGEKDGVPSHGGGICFGKIMYVMVMVSDDMCHIARNFNLAYFVVVVVVRVDVTVSFATMFG